MGSLVGLLESVDPTYPIVLVMALLAIWVARRASRRSTNRRTVS